MLNFNSDIVNGSKKNIKDAKKALEKAKGSLNGIDIPDDFIYASSLNEYNNSINNTNLELNNIIDWVNGLGLAFAEARETIASNNSLANTISGIAELTISSVINTAKSNISKETEIKLGAYGLSYNKLNSMEYNELNRFLGNKVLGAPIITNLAFPLLLGENSEIPWEDRTENMYLYEYRIENIYTENSVCEGAGFLSENYIGYCDVDTSLEKGFLRIMKKQKIKDSSKKSGYDRTAKEIARIEIDGHSDDIAIIPEDNIIVHIDDKNDTLNIFKVNIIDEDNATITQIHTINDFEVGSIAYDKETKQIVTVNGTDVEHFSKDIIEDKKTKTKPKAQKTYKIPDEIKDEENSEYYNYLQGITARGGNVYVSYSGFSTDKESYGGERPVGNMIVAYDSEKGGECKGTIRDQFRIEIESIDFDEKDDLIAFYNGGSLTRVFKTDLVNAKDIKENY